MFLAKKAKEAKCAKPAKAAKAAKPAKCAKAAKCAKCVCVLAILASLVLTGCVARKVSAPLGVVGSTGEVATIGNYSQWTFGVWAKEAYEDKGVSASFADGYASNGQTGSSDSTASIEILKAVLPLLAQAYAGGIPIPKATVTQPAPIADSDTTPDVDTEFVTTGTLAAKKAEAQASGKPLVVIAGNTGCSYCERMDDILRLSPQFTGRTDIIFYRETSPWASNQAARWTGAGSGTYPVLRVTQWDAAGGIGCDKVVNRPQSLAAIEAALTTCQIK